MGRPRLEGTRQDRDGPKLRGIMSEDIYSPLRAVPGFWDAGIETEIELSISITVDEPHGRLLGTTVSGDGNSHRDASGSARRW